MDHRHTWRWLGVITLGLAAAASHATEFVVLVQGQKAGRMTTSALPDGRTEADYSFRNNGRGPDLRETFRVDARGVVVDYEVKGQSTFGAKVAESFRLEGGRVRWKSRVDEGDEPADDLFAFLPMEGTAAYMDVLVRLLLQQAADGVPSLGGLRLRAERVARVSPPGAAGPLALVAVTGAEAQPWYYWVRDDGSNAFFAIAWPGWALVEQGHEAVVPALVERQRLAVDERLADLRQRLAVPLGGLTVIRGVRWFDAPAARMQGPSDVWLFDGRIGAVVAPGALALKAERSIDGTGRTLLPGLWDLHAHMWSAAGLQHVAAGVTSVREPGSQNEDVLRLQRRAAAGEIVSPSVFPSGLIEGKSAFSLRNGIVVESLDEGLRAIDWYAARGYHAIKLYNSIQPAWAKPLAAHAKSLGLRVTGHVPAFMRAEEAVRAGYDELTHINQVMLNFVVRPGDDTRTLMRFQRVGDAAARVDLDGPAVRRFIALLRQHGTVVDPTLMTFESMFTQAQGQVRPSLLDVADHLPVLWRRELRVAEMDLEGEKLATFRASYARMLELTRAMYRAGVPLVAGTDDVPGLGLHRELALYVKAGVPALEALRIATWNGARIVGQDAQRGRIARGYVADLVLVDGDPGERITDLRRASLVIQGRVAYRPAAIYEAIGFKPFVAGALIDDAINR